VDWPQISTGPRCTILGLEIGWIYQIYLGLW